MFEYGYGENFRDHNQTNLDTGILQVDGNFETDGEVKVLGIIAIRVADLSIPGSGGFIEYIYWQMKERVDADSYGRDKATFLRKEIAKATDPDSEGLILGLPNYYEDKTNHIRMPNGRSKPITKASAEDDQALLRSGLWKLMWIARLGRPGAIYDSSAVAQTFTEFKIGDSEDETEAISNSQEEKGQKWLRTHAWLPGSLE